MPEIDCVEVRNYTQNSCDKSVPRISDSHVISLHRDSATRVALTKTNQLCKQVGQKGSRSISPVGLCTYCCGRDHAAPVTGSLILSSRDLNDRSNSLNLFLRTFERQPRDVNFSGHRAALFHQRNSRFAAVASYSACDFAFFHLLIGSFVDCSLHICTFEIMHLKVVKDE